MRRLKMLNLPEIIRASLDQWIGDKTYEVCHFWVVDKGLYDIYLVVCYYGNCVHCFRFWGNEKDGYDMSKDSTYEPGE
jgi:hypothetical protein